MRIKLLLAASAMAAALAGTAAFAGDDQYREWDSGIRISTADEMQVMKEGNMTIDKWDEMLLAMKQEGLEMGLSEEKIREADADARIVSDGNGNFFIEPGSALDPVGNVMDAARAAYGVLPVLGGTGNEDFRFWSRLTNNDITVYSFQQIENSEEIIGSTLKVAVKKDGRISAIYGTLEREEHVGQKTVTCAEAEKTVADQLEKDGVSGAEILEGKTQRIHYCPSVLADLNLDNDEGEDVPLSLLWVVYTKAEPAPENGRTYDYVAHYVSMTGEYRFSLPVAEPGDEEALCGYRKQNVFEGMTADKWTGTITRTDGTKKTITVPVMYNAADKMWYLGDVERKIAVADFAKAVYGEDHTLNLIGNSENKGWEEDDMYMFYNYIRAWDFYADMGWIGPDGQGTGVIILKDLCTSNGTPYENACSIGPIEGWQMFGYCSKSADGTSLGLARGLDVMAHEFTHTFTLAMTGGNLYQNDNGAINEGMSDIMGNLVEYILNDTTDKRWLMGENTGMVIRSMSDPNSYRQPEYVWDLYYGANTLTPVLINDHGGVHNNSSLVSLIAPKLCTDSGMSLQEEVAFWTMTETMLTGKTDYVHMSTILPWALEASGAGQYKEDLEKIIEREHLDRTELPEKMEPGRKLVKLKLPDTEAFQDNNWALLAFQPDAEIFGKLGGTLAQIIINSVIAKDSRSDTLAALGDLAGSLQMDELQEKIAKMTTATDEDLANLLKDILANASGKMVIQYDAWAMGDTGEVTLVMKDSPTLYALVNVTEGGTKMNGLRVLVKGYWYNLDDLVAGGIPDNTENVEPDPVGAIEDLVKLAEAFTKKAPEEASEEMVQEPAPEQTEEETQVDEALSSLSEFSDKLDYILSGSEDEQRYEELFYYQKVEPEYLPVDGLA